MYVRHITVAMGGDVCIEGTVHSYSGDHAYNLFYGDLLFWGPKMMARNLMDYLNGIKIGKKV